MKKITAKLLMASIVFTITMPTVSVSALGVPRLGLETNPMFNGEILTDEVLGTEEFERGRERDLRGEYGEGYSESFERNQKAVDSARKIISLFTRNDDGEIVYPGFLGGLYINDEDNLVIQVVESALSEEKRVDNSDYDKVISIDDNAVIEYVGYSYAELYAINGAISDRMMKNDLYDLVSMAYVDETKNSVVVELLDYSVDGIAKFKDSAIDSPSINFKKGEQVATMADVRAGGPMASAMGECSVAYRARKTGSGKGFVTAGHCTYLNQTLSGLGTVRNHSLGGTMDAAWVDSANTVGNPVNNWHNYSGVPSNSLSTLVETFFIAGQYVGKIGRATGHTTGKITGVGVTGTLYDENRNLYYTVTNQITAGIRAEAGDSGGIVYTTVLNAHRTAGIAVGKNGNQMIFTRAQFINSSFGLSRY